MRAWKNSKGFSSRGSRGHTYDTRVRFAAGDLFWMANKNRTKEVSPKLMAKWKGPGLVTKMHGDVSTEVQLGAHKIHHSPHQHVQAPSPVAPEGLSQHPGWRRRVDQTHHPVCENTNGSPRQPRRHHHSGPAHISCSTSGTYHITPHHNPS